MHKRNDCENLKIIKGAVAFFDWDGNGNIDPWEMALTFSLLDEDEEDEEEDDLDLFEDDELDDEEEY